MESGERKDAGGDRSMNERDFSCTDDEIFTQARESARSCSRYDNDEGGDSGRR